MKEKIQFIYDQKRNKEYLEVNFEFQCQEPEIGGWTFQQRQHLNKGRVII